MMLVVEQTDVAGQLPALVDEFLDGSGVFVIRSAFDEATIADGRELIMSLSADEDRATHFQGANTDRLTSSGEWSTTVRCRTDRTATAQAS